MAFTALYALHTDGDRNRRLDELADRLEQEHSALTRSARLMNLPSWAGYLDAVLLDHGPLPGKLRPAHAGDLLSASAAAHLLASLIDEGPGNREDLQERMKRQGGRLCPVNCRALADVGYIQVDAATGMVSAHPGIHTGMATLEVHLLDQPSQAGFDSIMQFAHRLFWKRHDLTPKDHRPVGTAAYLNALGRALEATGGSEHPDVGPAAAIRPGWHNALNVR